MSTIMRSRRPPVGVWAILAGCLLAAVGCSSGGSDDSSGGSGPTSEAGGTSVATTADTSNTADTDVTIATSAAPSSTEVALTATDTGVTADSIKLGLALIDFQQLADIGVDLDAGDVNAQWEGWAEQLNASGGINGRRLDIVIEEFLPVGNETSLAACIALTEDEHVFMALGQLFGDNPVCFTKDHETPYLSYYGASEELAAQSIAPLIATGMSGEDALRASVRVFIDEGFGAGKRIGVEYPAIASEIMEGEILPMLEDAGLDIVATLVSEDFAGDTQAASAAAAVGIQKLRDAGVDMLVSPSSVYGLMVALQANEFAPQVVLFSGDATNGGSFDAGGIDPAYIEDAIAITPDNPTREEMQADPKILECIDAYNASDPEEPLDPSEMSTGNLRATAQNCAAFQLFVAAATAAGPDLTAESLLRAAEQLGTIQLAGFANASLGPDKHSAGDSMRIYEWDPTAQDLLPVGGPIDVS